MCSEKVEFASLCSGVTVVSFLLLSPRILFLNGASLKSNYVALAQVLLLGILLNAESLSENERDKLTIPLLLTIFANVLVVF